MRERRLHERIEGCLECFEVSVQVVAFAPCRVDVARRPNRRREHNAQLAHIDCLHSTRARSHKEKKGEGITMSKREAMSVGMRKRRE